MSIIRMSPLELLTVDPQVAIRDLLQGRSDLAVLLHVAGLKILQLHLCHGGSTVGVEAKLQVTS